MKRVERVRWSVFLRRRSGGGAVFVEESVDYWAPPDPVDRDGFGRRLVDGGGRVLVDAAVGPVTVGVLEELAE